MKEISEIYGLFGMKSEEMQDIADIAAGAEKYLKKASLPQTDLHRILVSMRWSTDR